MKRPLLSRLLPHRLQQSLYYRWYHTRHAHWLGLFDAAPLELAPGVSMFGLLPGDVISGNIAFHGFYEWALSEQICRLARNGGLLVDVGANMGYFSLLWAGANPSGRVVAFEAAPRNIALIENNLRLNRLSDRIQLVPKAAGHRSGTISFQVGPATQTGWGGISAAATPDTIEVPLVRLDEALPDTPIEVLKIDVEGADTWVLLGCESLLRRKRIGRIFFEQNPERMQQLGIDAAQAVTFLRDMDYACTPLGGADGEWTAHPNPPSS